MRAPLKKLFLLVSPIILLAHCGSNNNSTNTSAAAVSCTPGQVYSTQYGCLTPTSPGFGYGANTNGQQVAASCWAGTLLTQVGCYPQGSCPANSAQYTAPSSSSGYGYSGGYGYSAQPQTSCVPVVNPISAGNPYGTSGGGGYYGYSGYGYVSGSATVY